MKLDDSANDVMKLLRSVYSDAQRFPDPNPQDLTCRHGAREHHSTVTVRYKRIR